MPPPDAELEALRRAEAAEVVAVRRKRKEAKKGGDLAPPPPASRARPAPQAAKELEQAMFLEKRCGGRPGR